MGDRVVSAFLSVTPLEPVLTFASEMDAQAYRSNRPIARIFPGQPRWVYMPLPAGLVRVRTAQRGDVAFEFTTPEAARAWKASIGDMGSIHASTAARPDFDRGVYLGRILKQT